jgi:hypothetical protein
VRSAGKVISDTTASKAEVVQTNDTLNAPGCQQPREEGPDVSVVVFAHNNERHIRRCIESVLAQRGRFSYEVVVLDGDSSDFTLDIVREVFAAEEDLAFHVHPSQPLICSAGLLARLFSSVRGRYVAFINGNDEWVRPTKIQDQLDFLGRRRECFGSVTNYLTRRTASAHFFPRIVQDDAYSFADATQLIRNNLMWSPSSAMFRREYLRDLTFCATPVEHLAWVLSLQLSPQGLLGVQHQIMTLVNDDASRTEAAQREIDRSALLAQLRDYDELTKGIFNEDFRALAVALRNEIAGGAAW